MQLSRPLKAITGAVKAAASYFGGQTSNDAASSTSQELANYHPRAASADAAWLPERSKVTSRILDLARNDGWTSATLNRYVDQAVGARFALAYLPDHHALGIDFETANDFRLHVETAWTQYAYDPRCFVDAAATMNFAGLMGLAFRHKMAEGDSLGVVRWKPRPWFKSRTALQVVSPQRLSNPSDAVDTDAMRGGVRIAADGEPLGYWFRNRHPGDQFYGQSDNFKWDYVPRRTPWGRAIVLHHFEPDEAGQTRGRPGLATVVKKVFMANKFADSSLQAAFLNSVLAAYIESPLDHDALADAVRDASSVDAYQKVRTEWHDRNSLTLSGSKIPFLFPGEKIGFTDASRPNANYAQFEERILRYFATATGQTYEEVAADYSKTNYSSARAAERGPWKFLCARRDAFGAHFATPFFAAWLEDAVDNGTVKLPKGAPELWDAYSAYTQCKWNGPPRGLIDPVKEVEAAGMRIELGLTSLEQETADVGADWRQVAQQRSYERRYHQKLGLPDPTLASIPTQPITNKPDPNAGDEDEEDEDSRPAGSEDDTDLDAQG